METLTPKLCVFGFSIFAAFCIVMWLENVVQF